MTWTLQWELRRSETSAAATMSAGELASLVAHLEGAIAGKPGEPWLARGIAQPPYDRTSAQWQSLLAALTAVRAAFPEATLQVRDDMGLVGWSESQGRYDFVFQPVPAPQPQPQPQIEEPRQPAKQPTSLGDLFDVPDSLLRRSSSPAAAARPAEEPAPAERSAAEPADETEEQAIRRLLQQLLTTRDSYDLRRELERTRDPELVARLALEMLPTLEERGDLTYLLRDVLGKLDELEPLAERISGLWQLRPDDRRWLRDVANALESVASHPAALEPALRLMDGAGDEEREDESAHGRDADARGQRLEAAARALGNAGAAFDRALPALVERAHRDRERTNRDASWRGEIISALRQLRRPEAFSTLLLECQAEDPPQWSRLISAMVRCDADRLVALAPRLLPLPEVASELAMELGEVRTPEATEILRQLAAHPLARTRGNAARHLMARGAGELPLVAAVWASLDAGANPDDVSRYDREDALGALGADKQARHVDWAALAAAKGFELPPLPPLPSPLESVTHTDAHVRHRSLRALDDRPRPEHLLAVGLVAEVHELLHARYPRIDDYSSWYRWGEAEGMPSWMRGARDQVPQLIRGHAAELADQALTPALRELLERGAAWFVSTLPEPVLRLTAEELAAAEAEEQELIARRRSAASAASGAAAPSEPALPDLASLFSEPPPDSQGETMGSPEEAHRRRLGGSVAPGDLLDGAELARLVQLTPVMSPNGNAASPLEGLRVLPPGQARLLLYPLRDRDVLDLTALVESRARHLRLDALEAIVRDAHGTPITCARRIFEKRVRAAAWLDVQWLFDLGALGGAASIELRATWRHAFRARVATAELPAFTPPASLAVRQPVPISVAPHREAAGLEARASLTTRADHYVDLLFLVELTERMPVAAATEVRLVLAARNKGGSVLDQSGVSLRLPASGGSSLEEVRLRLPLAELPRARWIDFAAQGARTIQETLAVYSLPQGDSSCR